MRKPRVANCGRNREEQLLKFDIFNIIEMIFTITLLTRGADFR